MRNFFTTLVENPPSKSTSSQSSSGSCPRDEIALVASYHCYDDITGVDFVKSTPLGGCKKPFARAAVVCYPVKVGFPISRESQVQG